MKNERSTEDFKKKFSDCNNKFNTIFKLTSAASKIIAADLTILKVNQALTELLGYPAHEIEGTRILDHACQEFKPHWHRLQDALWKKKVPFFKLEACLIRKDGVLVWVKVTTILFDDDGETFGFTVLDDITDRKHFEESQKRLNMALKYSKMAVWEMNLQDLQVIRSDAHDELFGYAQPPARWTKDTYLQHLLDEDQPGFNRLLASANKNTIIDFKARIRTTEGIIKWVRFQGKSETDAKGRAIRLLGTINDITLEKLAERHKDDFIGIASHELKTPMTSLKASIQLLERIKEGPVEKMALLISQANRSSDKVMALVNDLLNASRVNEDQLHLKKARFNLSGMIRECCYPLQLDGTNEIKIDGSPRLEIYADAERIEQVIVNFVNNAIKYAPASGRIHIRIKKSTHAVRVSVTDKGPGIVREKQPHLFDRYYRSDQQGSQYSGLGLGLYISSEIIKKHGGKIGVQSLPGKGSTFWFTLPLA